MSTWTTAQINDDQLRVLIEGLEAEGFANIQPELEYGFQFTPMSGSEAGLKRVMAKLNWIPQMRELCRKEVDGGWTYYIMPSDPNEWNWMVAIAPEEGMIYAN